MRRPHALLAAAAVCLAGPAVPATAGGSAPRTAPATQSLTPGPMPAWMTYDRPAEHQAVVTKAMRVPVRDGSWLSCDLYRPGRDAVPARGRFPAVLDQFHGYGTNRANTDPAQLTLLAERGYAALQCNTRGTGGTPGSLDILSPQEARDGYDAVEWLARQPWSDGKVGMVGYSYGAISAYRVASLRPPHLVTIVPQSSFEDGERDIIHLGGARGADVRGWLLGVLPGLNSQTTPPAQLAGIVRRGQEIDAEWAQHPTRDPFWNRYAIDVEAIKASGIPILGFGGWYDIYQRGMPAIYQRLRAQTWLVMDDVAHVETGPTFYGKNGGPVLAWLDHWLQPQRRAPLPTAKVTSAQMPAGSGWTQLADWPPTGVRTRTLTLDAGALTDRPGTRASTGWTVDPTDGLPTYWNVGARPDSPALVGWHTAREAGRTRFTTPSLTRDLVVVGTPRLRVDAAFTATDGVLVARLSDVAPDGTTTLVSTGWLRAATARDRARATPVVPGRTAAYDVEIWPTHWRFAAGHRLQLSLSSGDVPRLHPDAPAGTVTVATGRGGSRLFLPTMG